VCAIAGIWEFSPRAGRPDPAALVAGMAAAMAHRGPDGEGVWGDPRAGLALGNRRLAIVDPTETGRQPMTSPCGRFVITVNGELYNHGELRGELESSGTRFRGRCDTEVMVAALATWGVERALTRFVGMFAFALWDKGERTLHLARDRIGEKPLYYGWIDRAFVFTSELKALWTLPGFSHEIDHEALAEYLRYAYVPAPRSIHRGISKLPPGTRLEVSATMSTSSPEPRTYWSLRDTVQRGIRQPFRGTEQEAVDRFDALLRESIEQRLRADVPMGVLLSGGLDSSTIASMVARQGGPLRTFSIGVRDERLDEAGAAGAIAAHLGSDHRERTIAASDALAVIPRLATIYDEPFADSSAIPMLCVSQLARESCKAVLTGEGADELLGGYGRYGIGMSLWKRSRWLPDSARRAAGSLLGRSPSRRLAAIGSLLAGDYPRSIHWHLVSHWKGDGLLAAGAGADPAAAGREIVTAADDFRTEMLYLDTMTLLPDDLLVKVDRASMSQGLEVRAPFLDPAIVEFCFSLPHELKGRPNQTKWILRQVLRRCLPEDLIAREKKGFAVPLAAWLRGPLRDWAESLLTPASIETAAELSARPIRTLWSQHLGGRRDWSRALWNVLMFQEWARSVNGRSRVGG
jgi:asparagine synthase (glutamine-hydrolysing)